MGDGAGTGKFHGEPCGKCGGTVRYKYKSGNGHKCVECQKTASRRSYEKHRNRRILEVAARKLMYKQKLVKYKEETGCIICGYRRYHKALDFHHIDPATKTGDVSALVTSSFDMAMKEVEKCVLLCRVCHAEVHGGLINLPS